MTSLSWVSENGLRFHIETSQSAAENGKMWRALCGAQGDCNFNRGANKTEPKLRCSTCQELSTTGISGVASKATAHAGDSGGCPDVVGTPRNSTWQAKMYSGEMLNGFERAVMNAEINAGIVRSSSDSENGDELDAQLAQGWEA